MHKSFGQDTRVLRDDELDAVAGGIEGYPGLFPGQTINLSPWVGHLTGSGNWSAPPAL